MAAADKRVPVTVLTGFLGSGKTTLLNHILASPDHGLRFAIIENEFGAVGVDEKLLPTSAAAAADEGAGIHHVAEELVEVMNGCICCTVRGDLVEALKRLHKRVADFDGVLIETTGMADPAPVAQTFFVDEDIKEKYRIDGIVTVVDAAHIEQHLDEEKPEGVENESVEQLAFADRVILNKCDLVGADAKTVLSKEEACRDVDQESALLASRGGTAAPENGGSSKEEALAKLEARIRSINPHAPIIRAEYSKVDPKSLLKMSAFDLNRVLEMDPEFLNQDPSDHVHDDSVSSVAWSFPGLELNVNKMGEWIGMVTQEMGQDLLRYKGVIAVKGCDQKFVFQGVHMLFSGGFAKDMLGGRKMKGSEAKSMMWQPGETRESRFVFIGKNVKQVHGERLKKEFLECAAEDNLRFKVGDLVEANVVGGWKPAKVIRVWDEGNPYRLELQDGKKTNVWGPLDEPFLVRAKK